MNKHILQRTLSPSHIKLQIQYGSDHHEIHLTSQDDHIRIEHLINEIERVTKVPKSHQTILYKGQRLDTTSHTYLHDLHLFNNSKLFVLGTQREYHQSTFIPEPNKIYEYFKVPYKTDPMTLVKKL